MANVDFNEEVIEGPSNWSCPFCGRDTTITTPDRHIASTRLTIDNKDGHRVFRLLCIVCPNTQCKRIAVRFLMYSYDLIRGEGWRQGKVMKGWSLIPQSKAKILPEYIPKAIIADYEEACAILELSPKASATLARRAMQGILRDFWKVKPGRLVDEILQIKEKIDPVTWDSIEAVRKVGNIGAHMEKGIDLIIDVDPGEAELLVGLIETLIDDWYVARRNREERLAKVSALAKAKQEEKVKGKPADA